MTPTLTQIADSQPSPSDIRRWRRHLADERAEAAIYRELAVRRTGEERKILLELADAEGRHAAHWEQLLGDQVGKPLRPTLSDRVLRMLARRFGGVFILALAQRAETRSTYRTDADATAAMAADEQVHEEVIRSLASRGRNRMSGSFRAAVFGANDGLVSNLALIVGVGAAGVAHDTVLITGIAGLLAGALSMGAGEYISVRSQRELLEASRPDPAIGEAVPDLDVDANELALVYRARGMDEAEAEAKASEVLSAYRKGSPGLVESEEQRDHEEIGTGWRAAISSFLFFASGAFIPLIPFIFGVTGLTAVFVATGLVSVALLLTGATVGVLSGAPPLSRALRQLSIGIGAAAVTYVLGLAFGA